MNSATLSRSSRKSDDLRRTPNPEGRPARVTGVHGAAPQRSRAANKPSLSRPTPARPFPIEAGARSEQGSQAVVRFSLPLMFLIGGYAVGFLLALVSLQDLALGVPFYRASALYDIGLFVASAILLYLSYDARDGVRA